MDRATKGGIVMGVQLLISLGISLILTIILEEIFAIIVGIRHKKDLLLLLFVNAVSNPIVVLVYYLSYYYTTWNSAIVMITLETIAILVEYHYFKTYGEQFKRPFLFAVCVNMFSFSIGKMINFIF